MPAVFVCYLCNKQFQPHHHHECQKECALELPIRIHRDFCSLCRTKIIAPLIWEFHVPDTDDSA